MNITIELTPEQAAIVSAALRQRAKSILDARDSCLIDHEEAIKMYAPTWATHCLVSCAIDAAAKIGGGEIVNGHHLRYVRGPTGQSVQAQQRLADSEHDTAMLINAAPALLAACQEALPWLVLLGDHIGNGVKSDPEGRCNAIDFIHRALIAAGQDIPNSLPGKK